MNNLGFPALVTESLAKQIAENLGAAIIEGRLKVNERLPTEEELARQFGVSRPTIREALKRLAAQKLVLSRRGPSGGTFVNKPSIEEVGFTLATYSTLLVSMGEFGLGEIAQARAELERICARLAAANREDGHLAIMNAELQAQRSAAISDVDFCASDVRFHRALVDATGNSFLRFLMYAVIEAVQPAANLLSWRFRERQAIAAFHERIVEGVTRRDGEAATAAMAQLAEYLAAKYEEAHEWRRNKAPEPQA
ncbi:MAG TPA: FadR/GntR family transcriptional regulator [Usitatibacter sp.]|nr:FadR/GntR family transcriptional regulator [Usitatibacter sp.]